MAESADVLQEIVRNTGRIADALESGSLKSAPPSENRNSHRPGLLHKTAVSAVLAAVALFGAAKAAELNPESAELIEKARTEHSPALTLEASKPADFSESQELSDSVIDRAKIRSIGCTSVELGSEDDTICLALDTWNAQGQPRIIASLVSGASEKAVGEAITSEVVGGCHNLRDSAVKKLDKSITSSVDPSSIGLWAAGGNTVLPAKDRLC